MRRKRSRTHYNRAKSFAGWEDYDLYGGTCADCGFVDEKTGRARVWYSEPFKIRLCVTCEWERLMPPGTRRRIFWDKWTETIRRHNLRIKGYQEWYGEILRADLIGCVFRDEETEMVVHLDWADIAEIDTREPGVPAVAWF